MPKYTITRNSPTLGAPQVVVGGLVAALLVIKSMFTDETITVERSNHAYTK